MSKFTSRHWIILLAAVVLIAGSLAFFLKQDTENTTTAEEWHQHGKTFLQNGNVMQAYRCFAKASSMELQNTSYAWLAAKTAFMLGDPDTCRTYSQQAWDAGKRDRECFLFLMMMSEKAGPDKYEKGKELVEQMPQGDERQELSGDVSFAFGKFDEAIKRWNDLFHESPSTRLMNKIAQALIRQGELKAASDRFSNKPETLAFDVESYCILSVLLAVQDDRKRAAQILQEAEEKLGLNPVIQLKRAELAITLGDFDSAVNFLQPIINPSSDVYAVLKSNDNKPDDLVQMQENTTYTNARQTKQIAHQARLLLAHGYFSQGKLEQIEGLLSFCTGNEKYLEAEQIFLKTLQKFATQNKGLHDDFNRARMLSTPNPVLQLYCARSLYQDEKFSQAVANYKQISLCNALFYRSATVTMELAQALIRDGQKQEALNALVAMHHRGIYSRGSLQLQRKLEEQIGETQKSESTSKALSTLFPEDASVKLSEGLWEVSRGKFDAAQKIMDELTAQYPENPIIISSGLSVLIAKGEYEKALSEAETCGLKPELVAPVRAKALSRLGRTEAALAAYKQACDFAYDPNVASEYAALLRVGGKTPEAETMYRKIIEQSPKRADASLGLGFILLETERTDEAQKLATEMTSDPAKAGEGHLLLARICLADKRFDQVITHCIQAEELRPSLPGTIIMKAQALIQLKKFEAATVVLKPYLAQHPTDDLALLLLSVALTGNKQYTTALHTLDELQQRNPDFPLAARARLEALIASGQMADAQEVLLDLKPSLDPVNFVFYQSMLYERTNKLQQAIDLLWQYHEIKRVLARWALLKMAQAPSAEILDNIAAADLAAENWTLLGLIAESAKKLDIAVSVYQKALMHYPDHPVLLNNFAWVSLQSGLATENEILSSAEKANKLRPGIPPFMETYAAALMHYNKYETCLTLLQESDHITRHNASLLYYRGLAFEALGKLPQALADLESCRDGSRSQKLPTSLDTLDSRISSIREKISKNTNNIDDINNSKDSAQ